MSDTRFLTVEDICAKHEDIGRATLHGTPPGNWFARWMDDIGVMRAACEAAEARALDAEHNVAVVSALEANWRRLLDASQAKQDRLRAALEELADLMDDVRTGDYKPDTFTTQPARKALEET